MDYFNGLKNEDFKAYFLQDLNCLDELTHYVYPNESINDYSIVDEHIIRCQHILGDYIINTLTENDDLTIEKINELFDEKKKELNSLLLPEIELYIHKVKVKTIELT